LFFDRESSDGRIEEGKRKEREEDLTE